MQRLLAETWRYQQLNGPSRTGGFGTGPGNPHDASHGSAPSLVMPVQFSHGDERPREPPPICSDLVEVRAMHGENRWAPGRGARSLAGHCTGGAGMSAGG